MRVHGGGAFRHMAGLSGGRYDTAIIGQAAERMRTRAATWRAVVACLAAYVLLWQGLLGAIALGAHAMPDLTPDFGVICTSAPDGEEGGKAPDGSSHAPDCCWQGCPMFGTAALAPPEAVASPPAVPPRSIGRRAPEVVSQSIRAAERPSRARAPPRMA